MAEMEKYLAPEPLSDGGKSAGTMVNTNGARLISLRSIPSSYTEKWCARPRKSSNTTESDRCKGK